MFPEAICFVRDLIREDDLSMLFAMANYLNVSINSHMQILGQCICSHAALAMVLKPASPKREVFMGWRLLDVVMSRYCSSWYK